MVGEDIGQWLEACELCPRRCGSNRVSGRVGYCGAGMLPRVFRYGPHFGEEPPISGTRGSGTIFFSHCTLRCIYCQNHPWSQEAQGENCSIEALRAIFLRLQERGCHNWNLVSPTPWLPQIRAAVSPLLRAGISLPFVYNTSGFEAVETLATFTELADIALIDLRYASAASAREGSDASAYVDCARQALLWFWERLGPLKLDDNGIACRGVVCRLLALPGRGQEVVDNLRWLAENVGSELHVSVMSQYTPLYQALQKPEWNRRVTAREYDLITAAVEELGFENGWIQEFDGAAPADLIGRNMPAGEGAVGTGE